VSDLSDLFEARDGYVVIDVHVQPQSGRSAVVGRHGGALKVRVAAPPVGGKANDATRALLARTLGVKDGAVTLVSGASSRSKRIRVDGVDGPAVAGPCGPRSPGPTPAPGIRSGAAGVEVRGRPLPRTGLGT
jgi:uncharacterized protein (TIGR00251 family)